MSKKTHWRTVLESDYLGSYDLDNGKGGYQDIILTIAAARREKVRDIKTGDQVDELIIRFKEHKKPMICNVTNAKAIEKLAKSAYTEDWIGQRIQIGVEKVKAFGDIHDALRVRAYVREQPPTKETPTCADCMKAVPAHEGVPGHIIADQTNKKYGRPLCYDCAQVAKSREEDK